MIWRWPLARTILDGYFLQKHLVKYSEGLVADDDEVGIIEMKKKKKNSKKKKRFMKNKRSNFKKEKVFLGKNNVKMDQVVWLGENFIEHCSLES